MTPTNSPKPPQERAGRRNRKTHKSKPGAEGERFRAAVERRKAKRKDAKRGRKASR